MHGQGGFGRVWLVRDMKLRRDVALKELRPDRSDNEATRRRLLTEATITGRLEHPGIVPIYEFSTWQESQQPLYTMRFIDGRTLTEAARAYHEKRQRSQAEFHDFLDLLTAFVTVCNTISYAHSRGVIHRDLKGSNVVLGSFGDAVILDWGLARVVAERGSRVKHDRSRVSETASFDVQLSVEGQALGTPAYMAPEQAAGCLDRIGPLTDVYGLGATLYEILTGCPPDLADKYRRDDRFVLETGQALETTEELQTAGGPKHYVQIVKTPVHNQDVAMDT